MDTTKSEVTMEIPTCPAWLSWVGATTACLNALGIDCDTTDVAGRSGYAFALSINEGLCPSGPTCLDWNAIATGVESLGRSTLTFASGDCFTEGHRSDRTLAHAREAFEIVRREVGAGRPCVVWGLGLPEFGVVRGVDGEEYLCVACGPTPERVRWDEIDAPGGPYVLAFPTPNVCHGDPDRDAIRRDVMMMTRPDFGPRWTCGLSAYGFWAEELRARRALAFGMSYNTQCWAEARGHARDFTGRLIEGRGEADAPLRQAHAAFTEVAAALERVAEMFPFTREEGNVEDEQSIAFALEHLEAARHAEERALEAMRGALAAWPDPA